MTTLLKQVPYAEVFHQKDKNPTWSERPGFYTWYVYKGANRKLEHYGIVPVTIANGEAPALLERDPNNNGFTPNRYWIYKRTIYVSQEDLTSDEVLALINEQQNRRRLKIEKAMALQAMAHDLDNTTKRKAIPTAVRLEVWQRDRGRCVECESQNSLEFDHIIPIALGGSNTARNIQLLCETCNRRKGASLG